MPGVDGHGPSYISAHSADVILSDIRPIKLKPEALQAINALLDEFLSRILHASGSLATDKLRASLLSLLPTSLGKEALLEAEVELRAYWERTDAKGVVEDDNRTFHLQWAFSLLRLKCEAYSTLNEADEDPASEGRINEMFGKVHPHAPKTALLDPAALYLTAILESMCEHILSNVGRVAARDSSRTNATVNDLFVALCEDDSIYGLFRAMKVYEHIEFLSKTPKSRRSKSFTRNDRSSLSRTSSPQHELTLVNSSGSRSRQSSDGQTVTPLPSSTSGSRTSFEKSRAIRMFGNNKGSGDGETQSGHKKSASIRSENFPDEDPLNPGEDAAMLREFDDLMRSTSTMKVSLTPDRLKTMEVYKQEKDLRSTSRRPSSGLPSNPDIVSSRSNSQRPSLRHIDSIIDEEGQNHIKGRARQASVTTPPSPSLVGIVPTRSRSVSTSSGIRGPPVRQLSRKTSVQAAPSSFPNVTPAVDMVQSHIPKTHDNNGFPPRTRIIQRNRDSMDLDDVMNGSDDDEEDVPVPVHRQPRSPPTPKRVNPPHAVSASTRDLMDFLAEGPPEPPASKHGNGDFDGPLDSGPETPKPKSAGGGRLQRMISKLNLGNGEKPKGTEGPRTQSTKQPTPIYPTTDSKFQSGTLSSLANRPIPPRPPRPISPHSSPSQDSSDENKSVRSAVRRPYQDGSFSREPAPAERQATERPIPASPLARVLPTTDSQEQILHRAAPTHVNGNRNAKNDRVVPVQAASTDVLPIVPVRTISSPLRKPAPVESTSTPSIPVNDIRDMQRLLSNATTADECRLILDMFMARNGIPRDPKVQSAPTSPSVVKPISYTGVESLLESSLVELFLGGSASSVVSSQTSSVPLQPQVDGFIHEKSIGAASDTPSPAVPIKTFPVSAAPIAV